MNKRLVALLVPFALLLSPVCFAQSVNLCEQINPAGQHVALPCPSGAQGIQGIPGASFSWSNENVAYSATPTLSVSTFTSHIVLSGNITSFTLPAGKDGQEKCLNFVHDITSTAYTIGNPSNLIGLFPSPSSVAGKHNIQCFLYFVADSLWEAKDSGVIGQ